MKKIILLLIPLLLTVIGAWAEEPVLTLKGEQISTSHSYMVSEGDLQLEGEGTSENPYLISSAEDLCYIRDIINSGNEYYKTAHYKQTDNIVLNESLESDNLNEWSPINSFYGVYDGGCFCIKGLYINTSSDDQGLFSKNYGTVKNLGLVDSYISANDNVGGIVGYNYGEICFCYNDSYIKGARFIGGICGTNHMQINYCYNIGTIECSNDYVGGIVSKNIQLSDENGVISTSAIITNCYNAGNIRGGLTSAGGISVIENFSTLSNCYNIGYVVDGSPVAPQYYNSSNLYYDYQTTASKYTDNIAKKQTSNEMVDGKLFENDEWIYQEGLYPQISKICNKKSLLYATPIYLSNGETINKIYSNFKVSILNNVKWSSKNGLVEIDAEGNVTILSSGKDVLISKLGEFKREIPINIESEISINGVGTRNNPYEIPNAEEFFKIANLINSGEPLYDKICYKVTGDIVFNKSLLEKIERNEVTDLIRWVPIRNFSGVFDFGMFFVQGLYPNGLFDNNNGEITGIYLRDSYINGDYAICHNNNGLIKSCIIKNSIVNGGNNNSIGGFCSENNGEINQSWNAATINGDTYVGGFCGMNRGVISNCRNDGTINGTSLVGGIAGKSFAKIEHCVNTGSLFCIEDCLGGIAGGSVSGQIKYCINSGFLKGKYTIGGITSFTNFVDLSDCYNIGYIVGQKEVGAITYQCLPQTANCFYDIQISNVEDQDATGLSTLEMTNGAVFNDNENWFEGQGFYPTFSDKYLSAPDIYPVFLSNYEKPNNVSCDFAVHPNATYTSINNRVQFDEEGNAKISSVGEDTIIINNSRILPIRITANPNEIVKPNKYYTLHDVNDKYLSANKTLTMADSQNNSTIFYLDEGNELLSYSNGLYINKNIEFDKIGKMGIAINFANGIIDNTVLVGLSNDLHLGCNDSDVTNSETDWFVEEATCLPVTITSAGYASFYAPVEVTLPDGVCAYYITLEGVNDGYVSLTIIEDGIIPANTGVILTAENPATYNLIISNTGIANVKGNLLKGTAATTYISEKAYVLSNKNGSVGLYLAEMNQNNDTAFINNSHKAYLPASILPSGLQGTSRLSFVLGETTAIEKVKSDAVKVKSIYDLAGRRINTTTKGIYITNGKKLIIK